MNKSNSNADFSAGVKLIKSQPETQAEPIEELFETYYRTFATMNAFDRECYKQRDVSKRRDILFVTSDHEIFDHVWRQIRANRRTRYLRPMIEAAIAEYKNRRRKCDGALKRQNETRYRSIPIPSTDIAFHIMKNFEGAPQPSERNTDSSRLIRDRQERGVYFLRVPIMRPHRSTAPDPTKDDVGVYIDADGFYAVAENQQSQYAGSTRLSLKRMAAKKFVQHFYRVAAANARQVSIEVGNKLGGEAAAIRRLFIRYGRMLNAAGALAVRPVASRHESVNVPTICPRCGRAVATKSGANLSFDTTEAMRCNDCRLTFKRQHVLASWALTEGRSRSGSVWSDTIVPNDTKDVGDASARAKKTPSTNTHTETATETEALQELRGPVQPGRSTDEGDDLPYASLDDDDEPTYSYQPSFKEAVRARAALVDTRSSACIDTMNGRTIRSVSQRELTKPVAVELDRTSKGLVHSRGFANEAEQVHNTKMTIHRAIEHPIDEEDEVVIEIHVPNPNVLRDPLTGEVLRRLSPRSRT